MMTIESLEKKLKAGGITEKYWIENNKKEDVLVLVNDSKKLEERYFVAMYDICDSYLYVSDRLSDDEKNFLFNLIDENERNEWTIKVVSDCAETGKVFEGRNGSEIEGCGFCYDCYEREHDEPWYQAELDATRGEQAKLAREIREENIRNRRNKYK